MRTRRPSECLGPAHRGGVEQCPDAGGGDVACRDACEDRGQPHLLDYVVRGNVRADAKVDAGAAVAAEVLQRMAIAGER